MYAILSIKPVYDLQSQYYITLHYSDTCYEKKNSDHFIELAVISIIEQMSCQLASK